MKYKIGICDTMFARADLAGFALKAIEDTGEDITVERYTVPGIKDLPVACKKLLEEYSCEIVLALGMPGDKEIDKQCAHEASLGIQQAQLMTNRHIIEVFIHLDEAENEKRIYEIAKNRTIDHAKNAIELMKGKESLQKFAGKGIRQGHENAGPIKE